MKLLIDLDDNVYEEIKQDVKKFKNMNMVVPYLYNVIDTGIKAVEQINKINKIADIVDGTIDHIDYDDAMDMLYDIKDILK